MAECSSTDAGLPALAGALVSVTLVLGGIQLQAAEGRLQLSATDFSRVGGEASPARRAGFGPDERFWPG
jgi:hypothetical protein